MKYSKEKRCAICGEKFIATAHRTKYCKDPDCKKERVRRFNQNYCRALPQSVDNGTIAPDHNQVATRRLQDKTVEQLIKIFNENRIFRQ